MQGGGSALSEAAFACDVSLFELIANKLQLEGAAEGAQRDMVGR